jgi:bifunctional non-homologous end joining protein LigD
MARQTEQLGEYARKRDFKATPEPSAAKGRTSAKKRQSSKSLRYVIQKHRATRLHYDFRLEVNGVLASWAVPKGPSLDPDDKRLAMHVEDHPFDYRTFEGIIPKGHYGAGEVIVWDEGTYELAEGDDPAHEIAHGKIKFILHGEKLQGEFTLVKIKARNDERGDPWLLVKDKDTHVDVHWKVDDHPKSVQSGADISQIASGEKVKEWLSDRTTTSIKREVSRPRAKLPADVSPMLATPIDHPFDDDAWLFELKWDGFRATAMIDSDGNVDLKSRNGKDLLTKFPELGQIGEAFESLPIVVDGEIVSLDASGKSSFQRLQNRIESVRRKGRPSTEALTYVAFDLLFADGRDLRDEPLEERKKLLEQLLKPDHGVMLSKHVIGRGKELFALATQQQLEGIVGKRRDSKYIGRRSRDWIKVKAACEQEFVIGGWTNPRGSRSGFGALLLGVYDGKNLQYAGRVGTGFDAKKLQAISKLLRPLEITHSPFTTLPDADAATHFTRPELVAEVRFTEWTDDGILRHPAFIGLREDKSAQDVVREKAV